MLMTSDVRSAKVMTENRCFSMPLSKVAQNFLSLPCWFHGPCITCGTHVDDDGDDDDDDDDDVAVLNYVNRYDVVV